MTGFTFGSFVNPSPNIKSRLAELDRQYDNERFDHQPYIQLAKTARDSGDDAGANLTLVAMERRRTWRSEISAATFVWRLFLDAVLSYGFDPKRMLLILTLFIAASAAVFESAYRANEIIASSKTNTVPFNSLLFAADTLIPIIDFGQKKAWVVKPAEADLGAKIGNWWDYFAVPLPQTLPQWLMIFNTFFGWTMTTLFAASVSGVLRRAKDY